VTKIKPLLPSLKEKKRYILYEGANEDRVNNTLTEFLGILGMARAGARVLIKKGNKGIIRINNKYLNDTRSGLSLVENLKIVKVSGVLNKLVANLDGGLKCHTS